MGTAIVLCFVLALASADPTVEGSLGKISGKIDTILGENIEAFLGIPYAKAPVGKLRFSVPEPYGAVGNLQATKHPPECPQLPLFGSDRYSDEEDCLYLNIFRKQGTAKDDRKAVMAILHGGGYSVGSSSEETQSAEPLACVADVIVVSLNYRLGVFGFADMKELAPGNLGLRDQRLALQWIQDHISDFGGDPQKVTLMGVSAGSMSAAAQIITTVDKRELFQAAVLDAGVIFSHGYLEDSESSFIKTKKVAMAVGCPTAHDKMLDCLRSIPAGSLLANSTSHTDSEKITTFIPTTDGDFVPLDVEKYLEEHSEELRKVRTIIGYSLDEGSLFLTMPDQNFDFTTSKTRDEILDYMTNVSKIFSYPFDFHKNETRAEIGEYYVDENSGDASKAVSDFVADGVFKCPINYFIQSFSRHNDRVFAYQFERKLNKKYFEVLDPKVFGVFHFSPFLHFGGALFLDKEAVDAGDKQYSLDAMKMISNFAKSDGILSFRGVEWPSYSKAGEVFIFNETPSVRKGLARERNCRKLFVKSGI